MNEEFDKFIKKFDMNEESIKRKYYHSLRVQEINKTLAERINLKEREIKLASLIGLLHDYGRFYQWTKYKSFDDSKTIDHADYAANHLIKKNEIKKFYKNNKDYNIIYESIKYHNKYEVPKEVENYLLCQMIRDADKIDLLHMYENGQFEIEDEEEISEKVKKQFFNHELISYENRKTETDTFINGLSFIFDINLNQSLKYIDEKGIIKGIYKKVHNKEKLQKYFDEIEKYMDQKLRKED